MIPNRYQNVKWEDLTEELRGKIKTAIEKGRGIYLFGTVGSGKTHAAYAIVKRFAEVGRPAPMFWNMTELVHELKIDMDRKEKSYTSEDIINAKNLLIIDDLGAERMSEWVAEVIYLLVNRAYVDMRPIVITSNLKPSELADRVGERIASRIVEMCDMIKLEGQDRRTK